MRLKELVVTIPRGSQPIFVLRNSSENDIGRYFCYFVSIHFDVVCAGLELTNHCIDLISKSAIESGMNVAVCRKDELKQMRQVEVHLIAFLRFQN
jgi:hypothetical protein